MNAPPASTPPLPDGSQALPPGLPARDPPPPPRPVAVPPGPPARVFEDADLIVIDKPAGLLSVPGKGEAGADHAWGRVLQDNPEALVVHRLDMGTSGLLVLARHVQAQRALSRAFELRQVDKRYQALVWGTPPADQGEVDLPLACDWPRRPRQQVDRERGKPAQTRWSRLAPAGPHGARLLLEPLTGRSHQLRVHLQALGHPILGDELYAPPAAVAAAPRLCLHAWRLDLQHPFTGQFLQLEAPLPF
ncbi:RluA family pseudouridine synthase [Ideonella livida]|uniref:RluA family pseudouridine synthase n=1 Tax=Ideonella livida TaxID=2707176 RepID=UPI0028734618|nr:RluA family pseudouridine synthase [Ideonella livida]